MKQYTDKGGKTLYRFRKACDPKSLYIEIFDAQGNSQAICHVDENTNECEDFESYTNFTFSENILNIWSCKKGFNCIAKERLGLFRSFNIVANGDHCVDKKRMLEVNAPFEEYEWLASDGRISHKSTFEAVTSGEHILSVMDHDGCMGTKTSLINVYEPTPIEVSGDKTICENEYTVLSANAFESYVWSTGDTTQSIEVDEAGTYEVTVTDIRGCQESNTATVEKIKDRSVEIIVQEEEFYIDQVIPVSLELNGFEYSDVKDIIWGSDGELSCDDCPTPFGKFKDDAEIFVIITDQNDCIIEQSITVRPELVYKDVYAANVFSPNLDNQNDAFVLRSMNGAVTVHNIQIFNRWGVRVFQKGKHMVNDISSGWDGTQNGAPLPAGVYVYVAEVEYLDKTIKHLRGDILLVK